MNSIHSNLLHLGNGNRKVKHYIIKDYNIDIPNDTDIALRMDAYIKLVDFITTHASLLRNKQKHDHFTSLASCAAALTGSKALEDPDFDVEAEG